MPESSRKLAAIVFTDIAGFTELSARDELMALRLLEGQRKLFQPLVEEHEGRWLKEMGDGLLLSFDSSLNAVRCAVAMQQAAGKVEGLRIRIGIHQGDIVLQGSEVLGDGVNIASRIEPLSPVGGVALSEKIQQDIASHPEFTTQLLGRPELKGVAQPLQVFAITSHGLPEGTVIEPEEMPAETSANARAFWAPAMGALVFVLLGALVINFLSPQTDPTQPVDKKKGAALKPEEPPPATNTIAILPFETKGEATSSIWTDGVPDDIRRHLSRVGELVVISRRSSEVFRDQLETTKAIAGRLGAHWLLTGTVQQVGEDGLTISVELSEGNRIAWSNKWDQVAFKDLLRVQEQIAREIAAEMGHPIPMIVAAADPIPFGVRTIEHNGTRAAPAIRQMKMPGPPTENRTAWVAYLEGRQQWIKRTDDGLRQAREKFKEAVSHDPEFALAHCYLAFTDIMMFYYNVEPPADVMPRAKKSARLALRLDPQLGEAHAAMGNIHLFYDWDFEAAADSYEKAIQFNPNHAFTYCWYGQFYEVIGDNQRRLELIRKAYEREPLNPVINGVYAAALKHTGQEEQAWSIANQAAKDHPSCILPLRCLARWHFAEGSFEKALPLFQRIKELQAGRPTAAAGEALCQIKLGTRSDEAKATLDRILQTAEAGKEHVSPGAVIWIYGQLDQHEKAYKWVQFMVQHRYIQAVWIHLKDLEVSGFLDESRLKNILEPVGLYKYRASLKGN